MNESRFDSRLLQTAISLAANPLKPMRSLAEVLFNAEAVQYAEQLTEFCLGVDLWGGNGDINEQAFVAGKVDFMAVRLNSITGGHHLDANFDPQWRQAAGLFLRWPYFVFNPWVSGKENFMWLADHIGNLGIRRIAADIEVRKDGLSPVDYALEVHVFKELVQKYWKLAIYTGGWFLPLLSYWPDDVDYWWARYPSSMYPASSQNITWEELYRLASGLSWAPGPTPGPCDVWQCSGDRFKLPGTNSRVIDVNLFRGNKARLSAWVGETPAPKSWAISMTEFARSLGYAGPEPGAIWPG